MPTEVWKRCSRSSRPLALPVHREAQAPSLADGPGLRESPLGEEPPRDHDEESLDLPRRSQPRRALAIPTARAGRKDARHASGWAFMPEALVQTGTAAHTGVVEVNGIGGHPAGAFSGRRCAPTATKTLVAAPAAMGNFTSALPLKVARCDRRRPRSVRNRPLERGEAGLRPVEPLVRRGPFGALESCRPRPSGLEHHGLLFGWTIVYRSPRMPQPAAVVSPARWSGGRQRTCRPPCTSSTLR
jgi:hypothetical protein